MKYHILCTKCKGKRTYEGNTLGECIKAAENDGWHVSATKSVCGNCKDIQHGE